MKRLIIIVAVSIVFLSGCANNNIQRISTIVKNDGILVVSYFDDKFNLQKTGLTAFQNKFHQLAVPDWKVDEYITQNIEKKLSNNYKIIIDQRLIDLNLQPKFSAFSVSPIPIQNVNLEKIIS